MRHTLHRMLSEVALLGHAQDLHWAQLAELTGCAASRFVDADGREVYASVYFAELDAAGQTGLDAFGPDDEIELDGTLGRYGASLLDGVHRLQRPGGPASPPGSAPQVRLSFVLVALGRGPDELRVSTPANARLDRVPSLGAEPDSYRLVRAALGNRSLADPPPDAPPMWAGEFTRVYPIDPDRDLNGVGLLYFANYVTFLDRVERDALEECAGLDPRSLDGRVTLRRRIGYYGNARSSDRLRVTAEAHALDPSRTRYLVRHRMERVSDGRLMALATAERRLRTVPRSEPVE
jgi:probable biosynthetic protein (TIGR04098 family)